MKLDGKVTWWFSGEHRGWSDKGHVFNSPTNKNNN